MRKIPLLAAAAALSLFAIAPASATVAAGGPLPTQASNSDVQLAAWNTYPRKKMRRSNHRWYGNRQGRRNWSHNNWHQSNNWHHHHNNGWNNNGVAFGIAIPAFGYGYGGGYGSGYGYDSGYAYQGGGDEHVQYCMNRYRSYDIRSDTFVGYDGMRHRCNSY